MSELRERIAEALKGFRYDDTAYFGEQREKLAEHVALALLDESDPVAPTSDAEDVGEEDVEKWAEFYTARSPGNVKEYLIAADMVLLPRESLARLRRTPEEPSWQEREEREEAAIRQELEFHKADILSDFVARRRGSDRAEDVDRRARRILARLRTENERLENELISWQEHADKKRLECERLRSALEEISKPRTCGDFYCHACGCQGELQDIARAALNPETDG